jgi:tetratricopeptide (TPR) repeat protein/DNA-binding CsgD family transcriptional regulator
MYVRSMMAESNGGATQTVRTKASAAQQKEQLASLMAIVRHMQRGGTQHERHIVTEALDLATILNDVEAMAHARKHLGLCDAAVGNYNAALSNLNHAHKLFEGLEERCELSDVLLAIGRVKARQGDFTQAIDSYRRSLERGRDCGDSERLATALTAIGNVYTDVGDYVSSLDHHFEAMRIREAKEEGDALGVTYSDIGFVYAQMGELDSALAFFTKALDIFTASGNKYLEARTLANIGGIYLSRGDLDMALEYSLRMLVIQEMLGDAMGLVEALVAVATIYERSNRLNEATEHFRRALSSADALEHPALQANALIGLSNLYRKQGEHWSGVAALDRALGISRRIGDRRLEFQIHDSFSRLFEELGDSDKALAHYKLFAQIKEELQGEEKKRAVAEIEVRLALEKAEREREIYRLKAEQLQIEVEHKSRELTAMALSIVQKNEMLESLKERIARNVSDEKPAKGSLLKTVIDEIDSARDVESDWKMFEEQLDQLHHDFIRVLSERHTDLTPTELKICALLKANLATKDIANLLYLSERTVENHRYRIRKKMGLGVDANLTLYLAGL